MKTYLQENKIYATNSSRNNSNNLGNYNNNIIYNTINEGSRISRRIYRPLNNQRRIERINTEILDYNNIYKRQMNLLHNNNYGNLNLIRRTDSPIYNCNCILSSSNNNFCRKKIDYNYSNSSLHVINQSKNHKDKEKNINNDNNKIYKNHSTIFISGLSSKNEEKNNKLDMTKIKTNNNKIKIPKINLKDIEKIQKENIVLKPKAQTSRPLLIKNKLKEINNKNIGKEENKVKFSRRLEISEKTIPLLPNQSFNLKETYEKKEEPIIEIRKNKDGSNTKIVKETLIKTTIENSLIDIPKIDRVKNAPKVNLIKQKITKEYITTIKYYSNSTSLDINNNSINHENQNKINKPNKNELKTNLSNSNHEIARNKNEKLLTNENNNINNKKIVNNEEIIINNEKEVKNNNTNNINFQNLEDTNGYIASIKHKNSINEKNKRNIKNTVYSNVINNNIINNAYKRNNNMNRNYKQKKNNNKTKVNIIRKNIQNTNYNTISNTNRINNPNKIYNNIIDNGNNGINNKYKENNEVKHLVDRYNNSYVPNLVIKKNSSKNISNFSNNNMSNKNINNNDKIKLITSKDLTNYQIASNDSQLISNIINVNGSNTFIDGFSISESKVSSKILFDMPINLEFEKNDSDKLENSNTVKENQEKIVQTEEKEKSIKNKDTKYEKLNEFIIELNDEEDKNNNTPEKSNNESEVNSPLIIDKQNEEKISLNLSIKGCEENENENDYEKNTDNYNDENNNYGYNDNINNFDNRNLTGSIMFINSDIDKNIHIQNGLENYSINVDGNSITENFNLIEAENASPYNDQDFIDKLEFIKNNMNSEQKNEKNESNIGGGVEEEKDNEEKFFMPLNKYENKFNLEQINPF